MKIPRANGCDWGRTECEAAAYGGNLAVLQWLRTNGASWGDGAGMCQSAVRGGHFAVLQYAHASGCKFDSGENSELGETCMY